MMFQINIGFLSLQRPKCTDPGTKYCGTHIRTKEKSFFHLRGAMRKINAPVCFWKQPIGTFADFQAAKNVNELFCQLFPILNMIICFKKAVIILNISFSSRKDSVMLKIAWFSRAPTEDFFQFDL